MSARILALAAVAGSAFAARPALCRSARETIFDVCIVGGGVVGLATARELLSRRPSLRVVLLERGPHVAPHQSSHNSGVIHSGIYYEPGTMKALCCVEGSKLMYDFLKEKEIPHERCGKLIVALDEQELPRLDALWKRALANKVPGITLLKGEKAIKAIEPNAVGLAAIHSPNTGIVRYSDVAKALETDILARGGTVELEFGVTRMHRADDGLIHVHGSGRSVAAKGVICCGGLQADRLARLSGGKQKRQYAIVPFRGSYQVLSQDHVGVVKGMIYPVPDPALPFLGVHVTRVLGSDGKPVVYLGPNAVLAFSRRGYSGTTVSMGDLWDMLTFPGLWRLGFKHWKFGLAEMWRGISDKRQLKGVARYMPILRPKWVVGHFAGVRAQLIKRDGTLVHDFVFDDSVPGILHVLNAPSPAATSCLAIGKRVADRVDDWLASVKADSSFDDID